MYPSKTVSNFNLLFQSQAINFTDSNFSYVSGTTHTKTFYTTAVSDNDILVVSRNICKTGANSATLKKTF